uniref:MD-2-related lipid-recognition domain-containing protein n=1 Tax=Anopheles minimus TaxID=112268 RepID=A0A182W0R6_9DIPT
MLRCKEVLLIYAILLSVIQFAHGGALFAYDKQKNKTRPFTFHITRVKCIETPYAEAVLKECRMISRRNQKALICVSIYVPKVYNFMIMQFRLHYKYTTFQPFMLDGVVEVCAYMQRPTSDPLFNYMHGMLKDLLPSVVHPCPHGNKTYNERTEFKEEYGPNTMPAGDYRMDIRFASRTNVTLLWIQAYFSVRRRGVLGSIANSKDVFSGGSNGTRAYTIFINRFVCVDMPYEKTEVLECRTVLRRNKLPLLRIVVNTPYVIDYVMIHIQLNYKFNTFQPFLINDMVEGCQYLRTPKYDPLSIYLLNIGKQMVPEVVQPCPQGNRIYNQTVEFKESYAPKSVPAGAYRFDIRLSDRLNVTMLAVQVFGGVRRQGILGSMLEW